MTVGRKDDLAYSILLNHVRSPLRKHGRRRVACAWAPIFHARHIGGHRSVSLAIEVPRESKLVMASFSACGDRLKRPEALMGCL